VQEKDPAPHFARLFALLQAAVDTNDYSNPALSDAVAEGARAARAEGIEPERLISYLRRHLHGVPLSAVGDWYRGVLVEGMIARAIDGYFVDDATTTQP
jgi:hypothetical protein